MIVGLAQLRAILIREAEEEYRLAPEEGRAKRDAAVLLAATRTYVGEIDLYVERMIKRGAALKP